MNDHAIKQLEALEKKIDAAKSYPDAKLTGDNREYYLNTKEYLKNMQDDVAKFKALLKGERSPTVGVFGCPSRGKSTLLNVLLGVDALPMKGKPGTTRFGTELSYEDTPKFQVTAKYKTKPPKTKQCVEGGLKELLQELAGEADFESPDITKIEIKGPFKSFLGKEIVFVDTPGVELGASAEELKESIALKHDFEADTQRALAILSSVDMVIFCMILKYKEAKDAKFYQDHIKNYEPINVINAGDKRDEGQTDDDIKASLNKDYKLEKLDTVIVSSKNALEIIRQAREENQDIAETVEKEFQGENLEGFKKLREMLLKRIGHQGKKSANERVANFESLFETLRDDAREREIEFPVPSKWKKIIKSAAIAVPVAAAAIICAFNIYLFVLKQNGNRYFLQNNYTKAIVNYESFLRWRPNNTDIKKNIADTYFADGQYENAIAAYSLLDGLVAASLKNRGNAYFAINEWDKAIKDYSAVLNEQKDFSVLEKRGDAWFAIGDTLHALADYTEILQNQPDNHAVRVKLGDTYFLRDYFSEALDAYRKTGRSLDDMLTKLTARGEANMFASAYDLGKEAFAEAIKLDAGITGSILAVGNDYFKSGLYQAAIETSTAVLGNTAPDNPDRPAALVGRAKVYTAISDYDAAIRDARGAAETSAEDSIRVEAYRLLGGAYVEKQEYRDALINYTSAARLSPSDAGIFMSRGAVYFRMKDYDAAIRDYSEAITLASTPTAPAEYYLIRGDVYTIQKNYEAAQDDFSAVINNDTYETSAVETAYLSRIRCSINLGDYDGAISDGVRVINLRPASPPAEVFVLLGSSYLAKSRYTEAIENYTKAAAINAADEYILAGLVEAYKMRGMEYHSVNDYNKAAADFSQALDIDKNNAVLLLHRARSWFAMQNYDHAIDDWLEAIWLEPDTGTSKELAEAYKARGIHYYTNNRIDSALADFDKALDIDNSNAELFYYRGKIYSAKRIFESAARDFESAHFFDPDNTAILSDLTAAYLSWGDENFNAKYYSAAIADYEKALKFGDISNKSNIIRSYLERAYSNHKAGLFDSAISDFERALQLQGYLSPEDQDRMSRAHNKEI
ncbi:tetratricopeptide repeat protein [Breznakiellaceae bacterium SP9]